MATRKVSSRHHVLEDVQALLAGTLLVSLGVTLLGKASLITGGLVGLTFLIHYGTGISFGPVFFAINLPFYFLALKKMGRAFFFKTLGAVTLLSLFSELMPLLLKISAINSYYAATVGGLLMAVGMLILFRHRASLGGLNVLVLYLQERYGWSAGAVQLSIDSVILLASIPMISLTAVGISILGALVLNISLIINHRPGRYMAI